jgi:two-component system nitrogen regulation response regulator NtrX
MDLLILEDEPSVMALLRQMLKGHTTIGAASAEEALRRFKENENGIDLLIADLTLPTSSGIQVALLLRQENPSLPVILASGYPSSSWSDRDASDLARLGSDCVRILQKPFQREALLTTVADLLETLPVKVNAAG